MLDGAEPQIEPAVEKSPPDGEDAWWGEEPKASDPSPVARWKELYFSELEREV